MGYWTNKRRIQQLNVKADEVKSEAAKKGSTQITDLASDANIATTVAKVNAILAALRTSGVIKS